MFTNAHYKCSVAELETEYAFYFVFMFLYFLKKEILFF